MRPALALVSTSVPRNETIAARLTPAEHQAVKDAARVQGVSLAEYARRAIERAVAVEAA